MSDRFTPILPPDGVTVNLNRGLKGLFEGIAKRLPHGEALLNSGLRNVIHRAVDEQQVPNKDFTAEDLAEHLGILQRRPKARKTKA